MGDKLKATISKPTQTPDFDPEGWLQPKSNHHKPECLCVICKRILAKAS